MFTQRQQQILNALTSEGKTTGDALAATLRVSKRTIYRDMTALMDAGIAIRTEGGPGGGIWLEDTGAPALNPARAISEPAPEPVPVEEAAEFPEVTEEIERAMQQVETPRAPLLQTEPVAASTPAAPSARNLAAEMRARVYLDASGWWQEDAPSQVTVDILQDAIFANRTLRIHYADAPDAREASTIEPYGLVAKAGVWYLVSRQGADFVADRLARIQSAVMTDRRFARQADFNLVAWWHESSSQYAMRTELYRFVALVRRSRIEFLRLYVGGGLQADPVDAQRVRVRFEVASPEAAVMIVLGLGQDAEVIEPDELPLMVRRAAAGRPIHDGGSSAPGLSRTANPHPAPPPAARPVASPAPAPRVAPAASPRANAPDLFPSPPVGTIVHG